MNSIVNLKDGFITFNSNIDYSLSFSKCGIGYSNYNINSHERGSLVFLTNNNANTTNISLHSDIRMCIASDGNVGIGTNNPSQKLDILGNTNISRILKVGGIAQNEGEIKLQVYCAGSTNSANNLVAIFKHPNDSQGIGITYDSIIALGTSDTNATQPINIKSKGDASIFLNTNSTDRLTILGNGNVGIGTTNTNYKLDIQGFAAQTLRIMDTRATGDAIIALKETNDDNGFDMAYIGTTGDKFYIRGYNNSATPRVDFTIDRINSNVGIGMTDPKYKLDVAGTINASNILINGSIVTANNQQWITSSANVYTSNLLGNVGIGITNPSYKCHIKTITDNIASGLHLDADDTGSNPNKYALTIWPSLTGGQVGWKFRTQNSVSGGVNTPLEFTNTGSIRFKKDIWHSDSDGNARLYFNNAERTYIRGHGTTPIEFRNGDDATIATFSSTGNLNITGSELYVGPDSGSSRIFLGGGAAGDTGYNHSVIESRNYSSTENTELLLFKGNDIGSPDSADRIRLRAGAIVFDTYPGASVDRAASNIRMVINGSGNIGVGTLTPLSGNKFHVEGNTYLNGDTSINGSLVVNSNLIVHGETTRLNTDVYTTERLELINAGSSTSFILRQTASGNTNNILNVINSATSNVFNITSAGNIGIGTTNPNANLHLHGNAASQNVRISFTDNTSGVATTDGFCIGKDTLQVGYIYNTESNAISIGTHNTERIRILADGNVGIGTNNIAYKLHIKMDYANIASGLHLDASDATPPNQYALTIYPYVIGAGQVGWKFRTQSQTGGTNTPLTLNHAGNITMTSNVNINEVLQIGSIGGSIGNCKLVVYSSDSYGNAAIFKHPDDTRGLAIRYNEIIATNANQDFNMTVSGTGKLLFNSGGSLRMRITNTGNVGIGTDPSQKLEVDGVLKLVGNPNPVNDNIGVYLWNQASVGPTISGASFEVRTGGDIARMRILNNGNVGIGTTNPGYKLDIQGGAAQTLRILDTRAAGDAIVALKEFNDNNGFDMAYIGTTGDRFYIRGYNNSSTPRVDFAIDKATGNIGIGVNENIDEKLLVNGNVKITNGFLLTCNIITNTLNATSITGAGSNITNINANNITTGTVNSDRLPIAGTGTVGGLRVDGIITTISNNTLNFVTPSSYIIPNTETVARLYPPIRNFTGASGTTTSISGQSYGNGNYTVNYTSMEDPPGIYIGPANVFNTNEDSYWKFGNYTNGTYNKTLSIVGDASYKGDGIRIQMPVQIRLTSYTLKYTIDYYSRAPKDFKIYGSNDGVTWVVLVHNTVINYGSDRLYTENITINESYSHYALSVNKIQQSFDSLVLNEWFINGCEVLSLGYNYKKNSIIKYVAGNQSDVNLRNTGSWQIVDDILPIATNSVLGGVKKGNNINIAGDGTISVDLVSYTGDSTINGNLVVNSNLIVHGETTRLNTDVYTTERLEITNGGTASSTFSVRQTASGNANNILNVINSATSNVFNITSTGNIGIGTTNPTNRLDIQGSAAQTLRILDTRAAGDAIVALKEFNDNNGFDMAYLGSTDDRFYIRAYNNSGTPRVDFAIDRATGNVGIGITNPSSKLHITTASSTNLLDFRNIDSYGIYATSLGIGSRGNTLDFLARDYNNGSGIATRNILSLRPEGNVGIGTNNPLSLLDINTTSYTGAILTLDAGIINATTQMARSIGKPLMKLGKTSYSTTAGDYYGIGFGYSPLPTDFNCAEIGVLITSVSGAETGDIVFSTRPNTTNVAPTERMRIVSNGNVGIGTTNPGYKLDIQGGAVQTLRILDTRTAGDAIVALKEFNDNNGFDMAYIGSTDDRFYIRGYNNSSTPRVDLAIDRITSNVGIGMTNPKYKLDVAGTINASNILINGSIISASSSQWITSGTNIYANNLLGNVGIGTNNPSAYTLQVNGTIGASGNITASYSDERLKNITEYVRDVLPILSKINVFKYNCNDLAASYGYDKNKKEIGLSAQEVQKYYPEVVSIAPFDSEYDEEKKNITSKSSKNYLTLDYERLVPILLQGIKDLNNKVVEMEENEIHMKNELNNIKSRLDKLELI